MKHRSLFLDSIFIGVISGIVLGLLLKWIESVSGVGVYVLLLNVDFIPIIGPIEWPELMEFIFHVLISIIIAFVFIYVVVRLKTRDSFIKCWIISFILCLPNFGLYFLLSELAIKEVPAWNDWLAFTYWSIAHFVYTLILPILFYLKTTKKRSTSLR